MRIKLDDRVLQGTALQIVQSMRAIDFGATASDDDYMRGVAARLAQFGRDVDLDLPTQDEKAAAILDAMIEGGLATKE
jgi:hypothetical protein